MSKFILGKLLTRATSSAAECDGIDLNRKCIASTKHFAGEIERKIKQFSMLDCTSMEQNLSLYEDKLQFYLVYSKDNELSTHMQFAREVKFGFDLFGLVWF